MEHTPKCTCIPGLDGDIIFCRLHAAAPEMLKALEHIGRILETDPTNLPAQMTLTEIRAIFTAKAHAAIKAAKGDA